MFWNIKAYISSVMYSHTLKQWSVFISVPQDTNGNSFGKGESHHNNQKEMQKIYKPPPNGLTLKRLTMPSVDKILWECKFVKPLWETDWHHPLTSQKYILYGPAFPHFTPVLYQIEMRANMHKVKWTRMFRAVIFIIASK